MDLLNTSVEGAEGQSCKFLLKVIAQKGQMKSFNLFYVSVQGFSKHLNSCKMSINFRTIAVGIKGYILLKLVERNLKLLELNLNSSLTIILVPI